uniref:Uncharacterized protein n=1 Tax=Romanomermis culicivorax TaxID=13658 RepID=A0A915KQG3_ROMCU
MTNEQEKNITNRLTSSSKFWILRRKSAISASASLNCCKRPSIRSLSPSRMRTASSNLAKEQYVTGAIVNRQPAKRSFKSCISFFSRSRDSKMADAAPDPNAGLKPLTLWLPISVTIFRTRPPPGLMALMGDGRLSITVWFYDATISTEMTGTELTGVSVETKRSTALFLTNQIALHTNF